MSTGKVTIPTDASFVDGTKKIIDLWGADAVRDCDGTELPENANKLTKDVYKTYFIVRGDHKYAKEHQNQLQCSALTSKRKIAFEDTLDIDLLEGLLPGQFSPNTTEFRKYWQVFDRTLNQLVSEWEYKDCHVIIKNATLYHEYSVNFFAWNLWDVTQAYNYICNGWTCEKDQDLDPIYPEALEHMLSNLDNWLKNNPSVTVVRFTTFFYHFFCEWIDGKKDVVVDWHSYIMTASPKMFEKFFKTYGYEITLEDLIDNGSYNTPFIVPSKTIEDYMQMVDKFVCETAKLFVDKVHLDGKKAIMFNGDNRIGIDPFNKYFSTVGLDGVVGVPANGVDIRNLAHIKNCSFTEGRFAPYFFPDTLRNDNAACREFSKIWQKSKRAILRESIDRIGFGGYLKIANKFPKFLNVVADSCEQFRQINYLANNSKPYSVCKVAILTYWGDRRPWEINNVYVSADHQKTYGYTGVLESLSGLPFDISFIDFNQVKNGELLNFDVLINIGDCSAFTGEKYWEDEKVVTEIRKFVYNGGGFIGVGEPTSLNNKSHYFQLYDILGVDKEIGKTTNFDFYFKKNKKHFISEDIDKEIDFANATNFIYSSESTNIIKATYFKEFKSANCGHVKISENKYGLGRGVYIAGLAFNPMNNRIVLRSVLFAAHKEHLLKYAFSSNYNVECNYYRQLETYVLNNLTNRRQKTVFYDIEGKTQEISLKPYELRIINIK